MLVLALVGACAVISLIVRVIKRKTITDILSHTQVHSIEGRWKAGKMLLSVSAAAVDFGIVFSITLLLDTAVQKWFYASIFDLLFAVMLAYAVVTGFLKGRTAGKYLLGINLRGTPKSGNGKASVNMSLKYGLYKFGLLVAIPYFALYVLNIVDPYAIFLDIILIAGVTVVFPYIYFKQTLWSRWAMASKEIKPRSVKQTVICALCLLLFWTGSYTFIRYDNNRKHSNDTVLWGFHFPYKFPEYPCVKKVEPYTEFMRTQSLTPKEYLLKLFERYDIVVLEETAHGESTQWEMIGDMVSDTVFITQVGNIFTEYGSAMHQAKIDAFLTTSFADDTILEQETAILMDYMSGGFYYFIKRLNRLNAELPDSLKVREHYTDIIDWDYFSTRRRTGIESENRDSLMAQVVIDWYKQQLTEQKRHKCLVVTNTRHAFGYAGGVEKVKNSTYFLHLTHGNQGQYIAEAFPDKTANIAQNRNMVSRSFYYFPLYAPIRHGIWDKAHALNGHKPVGFDLKNSPFGDDSFEYRQRGARSKLRYSDIFTGIIFNKPFMEQREIYHPYRKYAIEQEAVRKGISDRNTVLRQTRYSSNEAYFEDNMRWANSISLSNFAGIFFFIICIGIAALTVVYHLLRRLIYKKGTKQLQE
jgi:hypothetical protein